MEKLYYQTHVFCCVNERPQGHKRGCCKSRGADALQKYMKARAKELGVEATRINRCLCLDRCEIGPVMVIYPDGVWYHYESETDIDEILERHVIKGEVVERLKVAVDQEVWDREALESQ